MKEEIEVALAPLVGLAIRLAGRTADLVRLEFEAPAVLTAEREHMEIRGVALEVACPWRLAAADRILVGSGDLFTPADPEEDLETFDWEEPGASWLDLRLRELAEFFGPRPPTVDSVEADPLGGVRLRLSEGLTLELFPNSTPTGHVTSEFWRLIRPQGAAPQFVVGTFGTALEQEG